MDEVNLIEFHSPQVQGRSVSPDSADVSPGNNPFDSLLKDTAASSKPSSRFQVSPDDFFKLGVDIQTCGRESLASLWDNELSGRESLGILKLETLNSSFNIDNLGVPVIYSGQIEEQKSKDCSNSPLNTAFLHPFSYCQRKQSILSSNSSVSTNPSVNFNSGSLEGSEPSKIFSLNNTKSYDITCKSEIDLNNAFLQTYVSNLKFLHSSVNGFNFEFSKSLSEKYKQRLLSLPEFKTVDGERKADYIQRSIKEISRYESSCRTESDFNLAFNEILLDTSNNDNQKTDDTFNDSVFIEANHLASKLADGSLLLNQCFEENLLDSTSPPSFDELEANVSNDVKVNTETVFKFIDKMLPVQPTPPTTSNVVKEKSNTPTCDNNVNIDNVDHLNNNVSCSELNFNNTEAKENRINVSSNKNKTSFDKHCTTRSSSSSSSERSRDVNELLQNLSEIINNEYKDSKQAKGQRLLSNLANVLCTNGSSNLSNKYDNFEDSGHSSIENDEQQNDQDLPECYEVLDLRVAASQSNGDEQVLDLSMTSKVETTKKRLSQSFSFSKPKFPTNKLLRALKSQDSLKSSTSSLESSKDKSNSEAVKLKPKKIEEKVGVVKKGPLKAVIPLGSMSKRKSLSKLPTSSTPPKIEQGHSTLFKVKRTSTPIAEPQLKPIAQSTPDGSKSNLDRSRPISCSSQLKKRKFYCPISPLARPNSISDASSNADLYKSTHSGSAPNLSKSSDNIKKNSKTESSIPSPKPMYRRHSASELKTPGSGALQFKKCYSNGKDLKTPNTLGKLKENVASTAPKTMSKRSSTGSLKMAANQKCILQERNSSGTSKIKSFGLLGRLKKNSAGKENTGN